ncbi:MAG TPA: RNA polymerase sigma factor [Pseudomonadales bacterium]|jgi:RNA polymerase sigma-70 factor (ECF subfamily)|nr:RNA polymerase sigma factor [Pseudomonadales bacterium]
MARFPFVDLPAAQSKRFEGLVRPHVLSLYQFAYRLLRNRADAEDLVQDVLAKLYPRTNEMTQVRDLRQWLMRVVYHQFVDVIRRRSRTPATLSEANYLEIADPTQEPEHQVRAAQLSERVRWAVNRLRRDQQLLVGLHLIDGFTLEEVAQMLDVPLGTLKSRLHRTRAELKKLLQLEPLTPSERVSGHEMR